MKMVCETNCSGKTWPVGEVAVEVEEVGTAAHTTADSCCLLDSGLPAQAAEVEVEAHTGHTLPRAYRTAHNNH
jgi:hypothetical protein